MVKNALVRGDYTIATLCMVPGNLSGYSDILGSMLSQDVDSIILKADVFPYEILRDGFIEADKRGVPVFFPGSQFFTDPGVSQKIRGAEELGVTTLPVFPGQHWVVCQGIERILDREDTLGARRATAKSLFDSPRFYEKPEFLDMMINPVLKAYADTLTPADGPIVIDCGHIDSPTGLPTDADYISFEEGLVLLRYLQSKGHEDVKIGFLINEMYVLQAYDKKHARKRIERARKQRKRDGISWDIHQVYGQALYGYGVSREEWPQLLTMSMEGSLNLQARQELRAYEEGEDHPFQVELDDHGDRGYSFRTTIAGRPFERVIASPERGAPVCSLMSAKLNARYDNGDVATLIYLRDRKWRSAITCGARSSRALYGTDLKIYGAFYQKAPNGKVGIVEHGEL